MRAEARGVKSGHHLGRNRRTNEVKANRMQQSTERMVPGISIGRLVALVAIGWWGAQASQAGETSENYPIHRYASTAGATPSVLNAQPLGAIEAAGGGLMAQVAAEGGEKPAEAGWGGLTEFSGHVGDVVAQVARREEVGGAR